MSATTRGPERELCVELVGATADLVRRLGALLRRHTDTPPTANACRWTAEGATAVIRFAERDTPGPVTRLLVADGSTTSVDDLGGRTGTMPPPLCFVDDPAPDPLSDTRPPMSIMKNGRTPLQVQLPLVLAGGGSGGVLRGVFDLIRWKGLVWPAGRGDGSFVVREPAEIDELPGLPVGFWAAARAGRNRTEDLLRSRYPEIEGGQDRGDGLDGLLHDAIGRLRASPADDHVPVLFGSTADDIGIQPLLDAIVRYCPAA